MKGTTVGYLVKPPCSSRVTPEHIAQNHSGISRVRETSPHLWAICSVINTAKKFFLMFGWNFLGISFYGCLRTTEQNLVHPLTPPLQMLINNDGVPVVLRADSGTLDWKPSHLQKPCPSHRIQILNSSCSWVTEEFWVLALCLTRHRYCPTSQDCQTTL